MMEHSELYGPDHAHPQGLARAKAAMDSADRKRIEAENTALSKARTYIGFASDHLHMARFDVSNRALMRSMAIDELRTACAALPDLEAAYLDLYDEVKRLRADLEQGQLDYCDLMTRHDAHFVAWQSAKSRAEEAEAERDALRAALEEIADGLKGIARDIQIGPDDEGRDIYEMALAIRDDARAALKGDSDE